MSTMLDEIEAMILAGNQRTAQREELIKSSLLKAGEVYSALKKPSVILKKVNEKKVDEKIINGKKSNEEKAKQKGGTNIITCKGCGNDIKPGDVFCAGCGNKIEKVNLPEANTVEIPLICICGKPWREGTLFCGACGAKRPVVEVLDRICPKGHKNTPDSGFCYICGEKII